MKAAHTIESSTGLNKKTGAILAILAFTLVAMIVGYFLVNQVQNPAKRADEGEGVPLSGPNCPANGFICKWTREPGVSYHYSIKEGDGTIVKEGDIPASSGTDKITVTHTPESGTTYTCTVVANNDCGTTSDEKSASCSSSPQPTLISSPTPISTLTPSITPTGVLSPTVTPTTGPSPTLPPNVTPSKTPTPTDIIIVNATNTPKPGQATSTPKAASNPTLPTTGGIASLPVLSVILVGFIVITLGLIL
ncbi:hypothetical protein KBD09_00350 [Candidatus Woesebacteria bacterium]|nr:hypothetical protein [Candidatus Woesebacteria bacterium]